MTTTPASYEYVLKVLDEDEEEGEVKRSLDCGRDNIPIWGRGRVKSAGDLDVLAGAISFDDVPTIIKGRKTKLAHGSKQIVDEMANDLASRQKKKKKKRKSKRSSELIKESSSPPSLPLTAKKEKSKKKKNLEERKSRRKERKEAAEDDREEREGRGKESASIADALDSPTDTSDVSVQESLGEDDTEDEGVEDPVLLETPPSPSHLDDQDKITHEVSLGIPIEKAHSAVYNISREDSSSWSDEDTLARRTPSFGSSPTVGSSKAMKWLGMNNGGSDSDSASPSPVIKRKNSMHGRKSHITQREEKRRERISKVISFDSYTNKDRRLSWNMRSLTSSGKGKVASKPTPPSSPLMSPMEGRLQGR